MKTTLLGLKMGVTYKCVEVKTGKTYEAIARFVSKELVRLQFLQSPTSWVDLTPCSDVTRCNRTLNFHG